MKVTRTETINVWRALRNRPWYDTNYFDAIRDAMPAGAVILDWKHVDRIERNMQDLVQVVYELDIKVRKGRVYHGGINPVKFTRRGKQPRKSSRPRS